MSRVNPDEGDAALQERELLRATAHLGPRPDRSQAETALERDHDAAEQSHRDDLARDVARLWVIVNDYAVREDPMPDELRAALDRLTAAYLPDGPKENPR